MSSSTNTIGPSSVSASAERGKEVEVDRPAPTPQELDWSGIDCAPPRSALRRGGAEGGRARCRGHRDGPTRSPARPRPPTAPSTWSFRSPRERAPRPSSRRKRRGAAAVRRSRGTTPPRRRRAVRSGRYPHSIVRRRLQVDDPSPGHGCDGNNSNGGGPGPFVTAAVGRPIPCRRWPRAAPSPLLGEDRERIAVQGEPYRRCRDAGVGVSTARTVRSRSELRVDETAAEELGPIDYVVIEFPERNGEPWPEPWRRSWRRWWTPS